MHSSIIVSLWPWGGNRGNEKGLGKDQVRAWMALEDEINRNPQEKVFLMAFVNKM